MYSRIRIRQVQYHTRQFARFYSSPRAKKRGSDFALSHFDQFYSPEFKNWSSIRLALLCPHYYCAVVNIFAKKIAVDEVFHDMEVFNLKDMYYLKLGETPEAQETFTTGPQAQETFTDHEEKPIFSTENLDSDKESVTLVSDTEYMPATKLRNRDCEMEEEFPDFLNPDVNFQAQIVKYGAIHYPENWEIYFCPRGKFKKFPPPITEANDLLNYYLMDGASILPVLALDIKKGEDVGDLCASPGGKSLSILFGNQFGKLVCNDISVSRLNKLKTVLRLYLPGTEDWSKRILVSNLDVSDWNYFDSFDKILLDVPCTNDRISVTRDNNNIFDQKRYNERMQIPKLQTTMLCSALKSLKVGGSLVYSTCSLSPIQNDGVIHMGLSRLSTEEFPGEFVVDDLSDAFYPLRSVFQFSNTCRYGQLVVPFLPLNYGPMYIAKITRNK